MLKTLLKSVLIILVLSGVFFFALRFWEERRAKTIPTESSKATEVAAPVTLSHVDVQEAGEGATIQIGEVPGASYRITPSAEGRSFTVEVPAVQVNLLKTTIANPHPLITVIEVSQVPSGETASANIRVDLAKDATFKDRLVGKTLYVDLTPKVTEAVPTPSPEPKVNVQPRSKKMSKASGRVSKKKPVVHKAKKKKLTATRSSRSFSRPAPADDISDLIGTSPSNSMPEEAPGATANAEPTVPPTSLIAPAPTNETASPDLERLFNDSQNPKGLDGGLEPVPAEEPPADAAMPPQPDSKIAALPPADSGRFDSSKIAKDLPRVLSLQARAEGGGTNIYIEKEPKVRYRVLKLRNPNRISVEFVNAQNGLQPEYPGTPGTKLQKVTTQQFRGPDEVITRVLLFVEGVPQFSSESQGNTLIVKIP